MNVLFPLLFAPAKIVRGPRSSSVSSRIDLKLKTFHLVIMGYSPPIRVTAWSYHMSSLGSSSRTLLGILSATATMTA